MDEMPVQFEMRRDGVDEMDEMDKMADVKCSRLEMPADAGGWVRWDRQDARSMRDGDLCEMEIYARVYARWKRADEMKSADEMEILGVTWKGRDGKIVPALKHLPSYPSQPSHPFHLPHLVSDLPSCHLELKTELWVSTSL